MGKPSASDELEFIHSCRAQEDDATRRISEVLWGSSSKYGTQDLKPDHEYSLRVLLGLLENLEDIDRVKSTEEHKTLQGFYGSVPISNFEKQIALMCKRNRRDKNDKYFFDVILSSLDREARAHWELSLLRLYIGNSFNHADASNILLIKRKLSDDSSEGLYDIFKLDSSRELIKKINAIIDCFCIKMSCLIKEYRELERNNKFYDAIKASHQETFDFSSC